MGKKTKGATSVADLKDAFNDTEIVGWLTDNSFMLATKDHKTTFLWEPKGHADFLSFEDFLNSKIETKMLGGTIVKSDRKIIAADGETFARKLKSLAKLKTYPANVFSINLMAEICEETVYTDIKPEEIFKVFEIYRTKLIDKGVTYPWNIEHKAMVAICEMQDAGIKLDKEKHTLLCKNTRLQLSMAEDALRGILNPYVKGNKEINLDAPKDVLEVLKQMKCLVQNSNGTTRAINSTSKDEIALIVGHEDLKEAMLNYRELTHVQNNFGKSFIKFLDSDDFIHTTFHQLGTPTGRTSTEKPNVSGVPERVRHIFVGGDGFKVLTADYNQCELRILAHMSDDRGLVTAFNNDLDVHTYTAQQMFVGRTTTLSLDQMRKAAKAVNFGLMYGISIDGLAINLRCSYADAADLYFKHKRKFVRAHEFMDFLGQETLRNRYAQSITGRVRTFAAAQDQDDGYVKRAGANMVIQGTAADILKTALHLILKSRTSHEANFKLWNTTYDEVSAYTKAEDVDRSSLAIKSAMEKAMRGFITRVPAVVTMKVSDHWSK